MDEWCDLTIADIRQLELQTQLELSKRMAQMSGVELSGEVEDDEVVDEVDAEVTFSKTRLKILWCNYFSFLTILAHLASSRRFSFMRKGMLCAKIDIKK